MTVWGSCYRMPVYLVSDAYAKRARIYQDSPVVARPPTSRTFRLLGRMVCTWRMHYVGTNQEATGRRGTAISHFACRALRLGPTSWSSTAILAIEDAVGRSSSTIGSGEGHGALAQRH